MPAGSELRLGLLAYSSNTGLGIQTQEFAEHLRPDRVLLVDLSRLNHTRQFPGRFLEFDCVHSRGFPSRQAIESFLAGLDIVFVCETPLDYDLFKRARERGVKTILQPNHEFNDYYRRPDLPPPDLFALPSPWHFDDLPYPSKRLLPVPVATEKLPKRQGACFRRFLHVAGRPAVHDRNGTLETIAAFRQVECGGATLTVRVQGGGEEYRAAAGTDHRISIDATDLPNYWEAYEGFDCLVLPRKYGGLCLPMQEALGCGIPVIMTAVSPNDEALPEGWLVPAPKTGEFMTRTMLDVHTADVCALAAKIEDFCELDLEEAASVFRTAKRLGEALSWERLAPLYREVIGGVAGG